MQRHTCTYTIVHMHSVHHLLTILFLFCVHGCFAYMYFCAPRLFLMPVKARRGCWMPCCGPPCEHWELNPIFLTTDPSLQLYLLGDFSTKKIWMGCYKKVTGKHNSKTKPDQVRLSLHKPTHPPVSLQKIAFFFFFPVLNSNSDRCWLHSHCMLEPRISPCYWITAQSLWGCVFKQASLKIHASTFHLRKCLKLRVKFTQMGIFEQNTIKNMFTMQTLQNV